MKLSGNLGENQLNTKNFIDDNKQQKKERDERQAETELLEDELQERGNSYKEGHHGGQDNLL